MSDPSEVDKIRAENLKSTLSQIQKYMIWSIGSALSFFILERTKPASTSVEVPIPGAFISVSADYAEIIALTICWVAGLLASYAHERSQRISTSLLHDREMLYAILTYPSIATEIYSGVRVAPAIIAAGLLLAGLLTKWAGQSILDAGRLYVLVILISPYLYLTYQLTFESLAPEKPVRLRHDTKV